LSCEGFSVTVNIIKVYARERIIVREHKANAIKSACLERGNGFIKRSPMFRLVHMSFAGSIGLIWNFSWLFILTFNLSPTNPLPVIAHFNRYALKLFYSIAHMFLRRARIRANVVFAIVTIVSRRLTAGAAAFAFHGAYTGSPARRASRAATRTLISSSDLPAMRAALIAAISSDGHAEAVPILTGLGNVPRRMSR